MTKIIVTIISYRPHILMLWYCHEPLSYLFRPRLRSYVPWDCNDPFLTTSRCAPCGSETFNVIVYLMCSNEIVKNHCSNNDVWLSAYMKGWHISQNFPFILPNSKSLFYDRTEWWMEIIKSLIWTIQHSIRPKFGDVVPLSLIWCKEPFLHRVPWINKIILSCKWARLLH